MREREHKGHTHTRGLKSSESLTSKVLLAHHLLVETTNLPEEVIHLATLLVTLRSLHDFVLGFLCEELAHVWDREHNLLETAVLAHNLVMTIKQQFACWVASQSKYM